MNFDSFVGVLLHKDGKFGVRRPVGALLWRVGIKKRRQVAALHMFV
jgi:hypothetical protein